MGRPSKATKDCTECGTLLNNNNSYASQRDQGQYLCKTCSKKKQKEYYDNNKNKILKATKDRHKNNPVARLLTTAKHRAKKKGLNFNIDDSDIVIPEYCPILNIKLEIAQGRCTRNSPSLDRIIPSKGYVKGNVWVISYRANTVKNDLTLDELKKALYNITKLMENDNGK